MAGCVDIRIPRRVATHEWDGWFYTNAEFMRRYATRNPYINATCR
ncbi:MAG TPA: hypothetical protein VI306_16725 [Pyrinomonadaceae bacterium]